MALGSLSIGLLSGAASDLFSSGPLRTKAAGSRLEAQQYDLAAKYALQNEAFSKTSTAIKQVQIQRNIYQQIGQQQADVAGSGFAAMGSAIDLLRDSAAQGALTKAVAGQQGLIEQAGYRQQAESYNLMARASRMAAEAGDEAADNAMWTGIAKAALGTAALFAPGV